MTMKRFQGWASAEEFVDWEEANYQRQQQAVREAQRAQRAQEGSRFPLWCVVVGGSVLGLGFLYLLVLTVCAVGDWLESWIPWLR